MLWPDNVIYAGIAGEDIGIGPVLTARTVFLIALCHHFPEEQINGPTEAKILKEEF